MEDNIPYLLEKSISKFSIEREFARMYQSSNLKTVQTLHSLLPRMKKRILLFIGGIDFLDSLAQLDEVDGVIGNNNALFISKNFDYIYSAHTTKELVKCYELEGAPTHVKIKFLEGAQTAPLIFILRSFQTRDEYEAIKKKVGNILFEAADTFAGSPLRYAGSLKSRLRGKFLGTTRVMHCARRPTVEKKKFFLTPKTTLLTPSIVLRVMLLWFILFGTK